MIKLIAVLVLSLLLNLGTLFVDNKIAVQACTAAGEGVPQEIKDFASKNNQCNDIFHPNEEIVKKGWPISYLSDFSDLESFENLELPSFSLIKFIQNQIIWMVAVVLLLAIIGFVGGLVGNLVLIGVVVFFTLAYLGLIVFV